MRDAITPGETGTRSEIAFHQSIVQEVTSDHQRSAISHLPAARVDSASSRSTKR
jgi:hypothetical protein